MAKINESLAKKIASRTEYDKTIAETEAAYMKVSFNLQENNLLWSICSEKHSDCYSGSVLKITNVKFGTQTPPSPLEIWRQGRWRSEELLKNWTSSILIGGIGGWRKREYLRFTHKLIGIDVESRDLGCTNWELHQLNDWNVWIQSLGQGQSTHCVLLLKNTLSSCNASVYSGPRCSKCR